MGSDFEKKLRSVLPGYEISLGANDRLWVSTPIDQLLKTVDILKNTLGVRHLAVIVPEDIREAFLVNYIFAGPQVVVLQVRVDREKAEIPSLAGILAGAIVYEREMADLFGIIPVGHPDLRRQALPEEWPEGLYPMRKDVTFPRETSATE